MINAKEKTLIFADFSQAHVVAAKATSESIIWQDYFINQSS
ncbi:MAG: hypothetical protein P1U74_01285 [Legionellaceae bacterium]|nr:hypothetical protein [Legionellaceae bacterium]